MKKIIVLAIFVFLAALFGRTCLYTVNEREYALVFMLGELRDIVDKPGLHVKLPAPLQNVVYLDKRILTIDTPGSGFGPDKRKEEPDDRQLRQMAYFRSAPLLGFFPGQRKSGRRPYVFAASRRAEPGGEQKNRQRHHLARQSSGDG